MKASPIVLGCLVLTGAAAFGACGSDEPTVSEAKADFCESVADVAQDRAALADLNATSTVDEAQAAVANLEDALAAAKSAAEEVGEAESDALQSAYDDLKSSIEGIDDSDTLAAAAPDVVAARDTFAAQWDAITATNCGGAVAGTTVTT
jgi:hypothetical protein